MTSNDTKNKILSQIERLNIALCCLSDQVIETRIKFGNLLVGQEIQKLRKNVGEQWSIINRFDVTDSINEVKKALDKNLQNEKAKEMLFERDLMINELDEINNVMSKAKVEQKELLQKLVNLKRERSVMEDVIKSTYC